VGGGTSKIAFNTEALLMVAVSDRWRVGGGYRYLHQEYSHEDGRSRRSIDLDLKGPVVLATMRF